MRYECLKYYTSLHSKNYTRLDLVIYKCVGMHGMSASTKSTTTSVVSRAVRGYHNLLYFDFRSVSYATLHDDFICAFFYFVHKTYEPTISSGKYSRRPFSTSHPSPTQMTNASLRPLPLLSLIISGNG